MEIRESGYICDGFNYRIKDAFNYDIGSFKNSKLNGWGIKCYRVNTENGVRDDIVRGHFVDDKLNGLGIIYQNSDESFDVIAGIFKDDELIPLDVIRETYPKHEIEWISRVRKYENIHKVIYYGDLTEDGYPKGVGTIFDGETLYFGSWTEEGYRTGLFIYQIGKDSFEDVHYPNESGLSNNEWVFLRIVSARFSNPYKRSKSLKNIGGKYGVLYDDGKKYEGYIDVHNRLDGIGYMLKGEEKQFGIFDSGKLLFGASNFIDKTAKGILLENKFEEDHLYIPKNFKKKHKKIDFQEGSYYGELKGKIPDGCGLYYYKDSDYDALPKVVGSDYEDGNLLLAGEFTNGVNAGLSLLYKYDAINGWQLIKGNVAVEGKCEENYTPLDFYLRYNRDIITNEIK